MLQYNITNPSMTQDSAPTINATERNNARHALLTIPRLQNAGTTPLKID
jgi:hypothetical protein